MEECGCDDQNRQSREHGFRTRTENSLDGTSVHVSPRDRSPTSNAKVESRRETLRSRWDRVSSKLAARPAVIARRRRIGIERKTRWPLRVRSSTLRWRSEFNSRPSIASQTSRFRRSTSPWFVIKSACEFNWRAVETIPRSTCHTARLPTALTRHSELSDSVAIFSKRSGTPESSP